MSKIYINSTILLCTLLFVTTTGLRAQTDKELILAARKASNAALKDYQHETVLSFLTDDALTTTGNGTLLSGRESLRNYIRDAGPSKMYWIRSTDEIVVNDERKLAWESGKWKGYNPELGDHPIVGGRYTAMWTMASGRWLIKSQLFVTLE